MLAVAPGWELEVQRGPDWLMVKVENQPKMAGGDTPPLAEQVWDLLQCHLTHRLVLELDRVHLLDSYLIGQLVQLYKRIQDQDGVMRLCGLSAYNLQVLQTCCLDDYFLPYRSREEAVMGCCRAPRPR